MELSCTSWSFPACNLKEVVGIVRALGIEALDLGLFYESALDREKLLESPEALAEDIEGLEIKASNFYYLFGADPVDRNLADSAKLSANVADFEKVMDFCRALEIPSVMILPGVVNPGQSRRDAFEQSAKSLRELLPLAQEAGVVLTIEPHVHSYLESPSLVLELIEQVPDLKLTLDYAHFLCLGYRQEGIEPLISHAAHIHLRQGRPGVLQAKLLEGTINFPAMIGALKDEAYGGYLALEYVHQGYMNAVYDDVLTETVQLRDLVRGLL